MFMSANASAGVVPSKWGRGCGASWSREARGARAVYYGATTLEERSLTFGLACRIAERVIDVEPRADVRVIEEGGPDVWGVTVTASVDAEALAVFSNGPMHRKAIGLVRGTVGGAGLGGAPCWPSRGLGMNRRDPMLVREEEIYDGMGAERVVLAVSGPNRRAPAGFFTDEPCAERCCAAHGSGPAFMCCRCGSVWAMLLEPGALYSARNEGGELRWFAR